MGKLIHDVTAILLLIIFANILVITINLNLYVAFAMYQLTGNAWLACSLSVGAASIAYAIFRQ